MRPNMFECITHRALKRRDLCVVALQSRVKLLRKGAAGLNASSEGEIRIYDNDLPAAQKT